MYLIYLLWGAILLIELRALGMLEILFHWAIPSAFNVHFKELTSTVSVLNWVLCIWRICWDHVLCSRRCVHRKGAEDQEGCTYARWSVDWLHPARWPIPAAFSVRGKRFAGGHAVQECVRLWYSWKAGGGLLWGPVIWVSWQLFSLVRLFDFRKPFLLKHLESAPESLEEKKTFAG